MAVSKKKVAKKATKKAAAKKTSEKEMITAIRQVFSLGKKEEGFALIVVPNGKPDGVTLHFKGRNTSKSKIMFALAKLFNNM